MKGSTSYQVGPGTVVGFGYRLYDAEEQLVESSSLAEQITFAFGHGELAPSVEDALAGMSPGGSRRLQLEPHQAFGSRDPKGIIEVDRSEFDGMVCLGDEYQAEDAEGRAVTLVVLDVDAERVVLDTNHPLAGQRVTLEVDVLWVRPALEEELAAAEQSLRQRQISPPIAGDNRSPTLLPASRLLRRRPHETI